MPLLVDRLPGEDPALLTPECGDPADPVQARQCRQRRRCLGDPMWCTSGVGVGAMTAVAASIGQMSPVQPRDRSPPLRWWVVVEPEVDVRFRLVRVLGAGVLSVSACADVPRVLAEHRLGPPVGGLTRGPSDDRVRGRAGHHDGAWRDHVPGESECSLVVVSGPSIPPGVAISVVPDRRARRQHLAIGGESPWWALPIDAGIRRCVMRWG